MAGHVFLLLGYDKQDSQHSYHTQHHPQTAPRSSTTLCHCCTPHFTFSRLYIACNLLHVVLNVIQYFALSGYMHCDFAKQPTQVHNVRPQQLNTLLPLGEKLLSQVCLNDLRQQSISHFVSNISQEGRPVKIGVLLV
jgi:hypothetical protein